MFSAQADQTFDALGNQVRRDILRHLADGPKSVIEIAARFPISRPAISRHLAQLVDAGLVTYAERGTKNLYALRQEGFAPTRDWLDGFWTEAEARLKLVAENTPDVGEGADG